MNNYHDDDLGNYIDELERLRQEAHNAGGWIHVPVDILQPKSHEQYFLLHHAHVESVINKLSDEFAPIKTVLWALLATGVEPKHAACFVMDTWFASIPRDSNPWDMDEELACELMKAMAGTLAEGLLTSIGFSRLGDTCRPLGEWIEQHNPANNLDMDVWGEVLG